MFSKALKKYINWRSSIYSQVVNVIIIMSVLMYIVFALIFRSTNEKHMQSVLEQCANRIAYLVEGSIYTGMLENNKDEIKGTLNLIKTMPGIDEVDLYDSRDSLVYTTLTDEAIGDSLSRCTPHCVSCHTNDEFFSRTEKTYHVIGPRTMDPKGEKQAVHRQLVIVSPVANAPSCYEAACHVHRKDELSLGTLLIKIPLKSLDDALFDTTINYFELASITTLLLILAIILFTRRKIRMPLQQIIKASEAVAAGNMDKRLEESDGQLSDMNKVSRAFNHMLDKLDKANSELHVWSRQLEYKVQKKSKELKDTQNELIHIERMASLGKLSSSVAHEINNPLAGVLTYTKLVQKQINKQEFPEDRKKALLSHLAMIESETRRCGDIVKGLLDFSRKETKDYEDVNIQKVLQETYELMLHPMKMAEINFISHFHAEHDLVHCSPNQIKQACIALLVNASEATDAGGEVRFSCIEDAESDHLHIEIADDGSGIAEEDLPHIFEPFFSKKQKTSGIGLGLSVVHGIVESHKGRIKVESEVNKGTKMHIYLPLVL